MKQILIRTDKLANISELSYEERGKLLTMLLTMGLDTPNEEQVEELNALYTEFIGDRFLRMAFLPFKADFDEDKKKYEKIVQRNQTNGKKGGRPRKSPVSQSVLKTTQSVDPEPRKTTIDGLSTINPNHNISIEKEEKDFGVRKQSTPTLDEVIVAANTLMIANDMATRFFYYYDALGWKIGDRPIVNWKSKLMEWKNNPKTFENNANTRNNHQQFVDSRAEAIKLATLSALQSSSRGVTEEFDYDVL